MEDTQTKLQKLEKIAGRKIPSETIPECYLLDQAIMHNDLGTLRNYSKNLVTK